MLLVATLDLSTTTTSALPINPSPTTAPAGTVLTLSCFISLVYLCTNIYLVSSLPCWVDFRLVLQMFDPFPPYSNLAADDIEKNLECSLCWKKWTFLMLESFENIVAREEICHNIFKCRKNEYLWSKGLKRGVSSPSLLNNCFYLLFIIRHYCFVYGIL